MKSFLNKNLVLLIIALFSAVGFFVLSYLTILDYYYDLEEQYITSCNTEIIGELETSMKYGKSIRSYYGLTELLGKASELLKTDCILVIKDADGSDVASTEYMNSFTVDTSEYGTIEQEILDKNDKRAGTLITYYSKSGIRSQIHGSMRAAAVGSLIIVGLMFAVCLTLAAIKKISRRSLIFIIITAIVIQGAFLSIIYLPKFRSAALQNAKGVAQYLEGSFRSMTRKGIMPDDISDLDDYLKTMSDSYEWVDSIEITSADAKDDDITYIVPIGKKSQNTALAVKTSENYIGKSVTEMVMTFIATIIIAVIIMKESLLISNISHFRKSKLFGTRCRAQFASIAHILRYSCFLSSTFSYMCLSFAALQIKEWGTGFWGLSPEMSAAASISICSLAEAAGMLIMPFVSTKLGNRSLHVFSTLLLTVANFACFFTTSALVMVAMRFLAGIGFAGNKQVTNIMITVGCETEKEKSANLAASNYGIIGGILCGMCLGSIIAGVFGYSATFLAAGIGCITFLVFELHCVPWKILTNTDTRTKKHRTSKLIKAFFSPAVWRSVIIIVMPQYFFLMVIVSLIPGVIQAGGYPPVLLTYANLLNGVFGLYVGEYLGKFMTKKFGGGKTLSIMFATGAVGMLLLEINAAPSLMILISAVLLGFVDGVGTPLATYIFLGSTGLSQSVGADYALMIYSLLGFVFMTIAPIILELCVTSSIVLYSCCIVLGIIAALLFIGNSAKKRS